MKAHSLRLLFSVCVLVLVTGCSTGPLTPTATSSTSHTLSGAIHGGQQPVAGATIQLYTVGTTGDGSAAQPLLTKTVTTDSNGFFTITGDYSCTGATQVYLTGRGGNPGLSAPNPNLLMMAALGSCTTVQTTPYIWVSELTTVAAAYALAPFATSATSIGSGTSDATALANAFTLANEYVNTTNDQAPGVNIPSGSTDPTLLLNTLANIIATCVNSTGGVANDGTTLCGSLFGLTTSNGSVPTDTFAALLNLARNPTLNTSSLFNLTSSNAPFQPMYTQVPPDFNVHLSDANGTYLLVQPYPAAALGDEAVNGPTESVDISLTNKQIYNSITVNSINFIGPNAGDFSVGVYCPANNILTPNLGCTLQVYAIAGGVGPRLAYLQINSSAPDSPQYVQLTLNGTVVPSAPSSIFLSSFTGTNGTSGTPVNFTGQILSYAATASGSASATATYNGAHDTAYPVLRTDYVGHLYSSATNSDTGANTITAYNIGSAGTLTATRSFTPIAPGSYILNTTHAFASDNGGQVYVPVTLPGASPQIGLAVYPANATGSTAASFVLTGYGTAAAIDPSGDLLTLDPTGNILEYGFGIMSTSTPYLQINVQSLYSGASGAGPIDLATDGAGNVYLLLYGHQGYEVVEYKAPFYGNNYPTRDYFGPASGFNKPTALAVDATGNIYVSDTSPTTLKPMVVVYASTNNGSLPPTILYPATPIAGGIAVH